MFLWISTLVESKTIHYYNNAQSEGSNCTKVNGEEGVCQNIENCSEDLESIKNENICAFNGIRPIVCCKHLGLQNDRTGTAMIFDKNNEGVKYAIDACLIFYPKKNDQSGRWPAKRGEHPHMTAIGWIIEENKIDWNCGGSLISWNYVLTAAHCVAGPKPDIVRVNDISVKDSLPGNQSADFSIKNIFIYPDYNSTEVYHDLAILEVEKLTNGKYSPRPACLWPSEELSVSEVFVMGFGTSSFGGPKTNTLYQGNLTLVNLEECRKIYGTKKRYPLGLMDFQICAHDTRRLVDTCQGDSGGPLQFTQPLNRNRAAIPYLVGVTSFGQGCFGPTPAVYMRIYPYLNWIKSIVWENGL